MPTKIVENKCGFVLIEVLISIALFALSALAIVSMILGTLNLMQKSAEYSSASNLSQEGIAAVKAIRNRAWNELKYQKSSIVFENGWYLSGEGTKEQIGNFTRQISFEPVYRNGAFDIVNESDSEALLDMNTLKIISNISWEDGNKNLSLNSNAFIGNWESMVWLQDSWTGGDGQEIIGENNFYLEKNNISATDSLTLLSLGTSTFVSLGYLESSAFGPTEEGIFSVLLWEDEAPENCSTCLVKIQIKTAEDVSGLPGDWSDTWCGPDGEDGDENDYFENKSANLINTSHNGDQWIKYKVYLEGDGFSSPELRLIKIYYR